jgi:hypothetical protein
MKREKNESPTVAFTSAELEKAKSTLKKRDQKTPIANNSTDNFSTTTPTNDLMVGLEIALRKRRATIQY